MPPKKRARDAEEDEDELDEQTGKKLFGERFSKYRKQGEDFRSKKADLKKMKSEWEEEVKAAREFAGKRSGSAWREGKNEEKFKEFETKKTKKTDPERLAFEKKYVQGAYPYRRVADELPDKITKTKAEKHELKRKLASNYGKMERQAALYDQIAEEAEEEERAKPKPIESTAPEREKSPQPPAATQAQPQAQKTN